MIFLSYVKVGKAQNQINGIGKIFHVQSSALKALSLIAKKLIVEIIYRSSFNLTKHGRNDQENQPRV